MIVECKVFGNSSAPISIASGPIKRNSREDSSSEPKQNSKFSYLTKCYAEHRSLLSNVPVRYEGSRDQPIVFQSSGRVKDRDRRMITRLENYKEARANALYK